MTEPSKFKVGKNSRVGWHQFIGKLNVLLERVEKHSEIIGELTDTGKSKPLPRRSGRSERRVNAVGETVRVANMTEESLGIYHVIRIERNDDRDGNVLLNEYHNQTSILLGKIPKGDETAFGVTLDMASPKAVIPVKVSGVVGVIIDVKDTSHEFATTKSNAIDTLVSSESGYARILTSPKETGKQFCLVILGGGSGSGTGTGGSPMTLGRLDADLTQNSIRSASVNTTVFERNGIAIVPSATKVVAYAYILNPDETLEKDQFVWMTFANGRWEIVAANCPEIKE